MAKKHFSKTINEVMALSGLSVEDVQEGLEKAFMTEEDTESYSLDEVCEVCNHATRNSPEWLAALYVWITLSRKEVKKARTWSNTRLAYTRTPEGTKVRVKAFEKLIDCTEKCPEIMWVASRTTAPCYEEHAEKIQKKIEKLCKKNAS